MGETDLPQDLSVGSWPDWNHVDDSLCLKNRPFEIPNAGEVEQDVRWGLRMNERPRLLGMGLEECRRIIAELRGKSNYY